MSISVHLFGISSWIITTVLLAVALGAFAFSMYRWLEIVRLGEEDDRFSSLKERIKGVFTFVFAQKRMFKYSVAGVMHAFIFWGFCVLTLRAISLIVAGFSFDFVYRLSTTAPGLWYLLVKDIFAGLVLFFVGVALFRRLVIKPERVHLSWDALFILTLISFIMITDFAMEGAFFNLEPETTTRAYQPISAQVGLAMNNLSEGALEAIFKASFWGHIFIILFFLNYLPYSKHFHVITSLPNVFARRLQPMGKIPKMEITEETESFGVGTFDKLSWKNVFDVYTCTECGRCHDFCPAWRSGKPLSPMRVNIAIRDHLQDNADYFKSIVRKEEVDRDEELDTIVGPVVHKDTIWSCTTCGYCEEACPLLIENFQRFVHLRQDQVLMKGDFPAEAQPALEGMERQSNPWGMNKQDRDKWAEDLDIKRASEGDCEVLYWVGCAGSYDKRYQNVSRSIVEILKAADVDFAILGKDECCTGDSARRLGNEYLFQMMAEQNVETLNNHNFKKILTSCPHCFNTFKNEYPDFGGQWEVVHHSQFIEELLEEGKIEVETGGEDRVIFHDSCYMGRHNNVYDAPRKVIEESTGSVGEFKLNRERGFCCGAGGGRMWMEENIGDRVNKLRLKQAEESQPDANVVGTNCPFCMIMFDDAITSTDKGEEMKTLDIAEIVAQRLKNGATQKEEEV